MLFKAFCKHQLWYCFSINLLLVGLFIFPATQANETNQQIKKNTHTLEQLNKKISGIKTHIKKNLSQRQHLEDNLQAIEKHMSMLNQNLSATQIQIKKQSLILTQLNNKRGVYSKQLKKQQLLLAEQVRIAYLLGKHHYIKLLLNQQNPNAVPRYLYYLHSMDSTRLELIKAIQMTLIKIQTNKNNIENQKLKLTSLAKNQANEKQQLFDAINSRKKVIAALNQDINTSHEKLTELLHNHKLLQSLLSRLKKQRKLLSLQPKIPFSRMQGKLKLPTKGIITTHFGSYVDHSQLQNQGILISAPDGQAVHAIYPGKVIFANWLRGLGLLIIIDHGHGYLSLYGHNQSIITHVGQLVTRNQVIATVGQSGGYQRSGLYFQIRHNKKPLNPEVWCR
ncbi:MAG: peptidoglycan DD-metalloendopeptidase family protein [Pseudomonadota bacterium]